MKMQVQACDYLYPSNGSPYSPMANSTPGSDSNNSSPDSGYSEPRPYRANYPQQRNSQLMDLSSPMPAHQQHPDIHRQHFQSVRVQNYQTGLTVEQQYYAHQELNNYSSDLMNGNFMNEQKQRFYAQQNLHQAHQYQQQQQQPPMPINVYGYNLPTADYQRTLVQQQQQQQHHQYHHQVSPQPQLSPAEQFAHQTYSEQAIAYAEAMNFASQQIAVGKQRVITANRTCNTKRKRKALDDENMNVQPTKMAKFDETTAATNVICEDAFEDFEDQRLTASMRERQRTQELNKAYGNLRHTIPCLPSDKLSKIQTVRLAAKYIEFLQEVLEYGAMSEAERQANAGPKSAALAIALESIQSSKPTPNGTPAHEKFSYAFSLWRVHSEM